MKDIFKKKKVPRLQYRPLHKNNQGRLKGRCSFCNEKSVFRIFACDGMNRIACVICLHSTRYYKHIKPELNSIFRHTDLTTLEKIKLVLKRTFIGNRLYYPFGIRRR